MMCILNWFNYFENSLINERKINKRKFLNIFNLYSIYIKFIIINLIRSFQIFTKQNALI